MSRLVRVVSCFLAVAALLLASAPAAAGPILETPVYNVDLPGNGGSFQVWGQVEAGGVGYIYRYFVKNEARIIPRRFELGIAEDPSHAGLHDEVNDDVTPGNGSLFYDMSPHVNPTHNYVWSQKVNLGKFGFFLGIVIPPRGTRELSFEDTHAPTLANWSLRELEPFASIATNVELGFGGLPVPFIEKLPPPIPTNKVPEPTTLTLAAIGIFGAGLSAYRRRRKQLAVQV